METVNRFLGFLTFSCWPFKVKDKQHIWLFHEPILFIYSFINLCICLFCIYIFICIYLYFWVDLKPEALLPHCEPDEETVKQLLSVWHDVNKICFVFFTRGERDDPQENQWVSEYIHYMYSYISQVSFPLPNFHLLSFFSCCCLILKWFSAQF